MFLKSITSYIKESVTANTNYKYKIIEITENSPKDIIIKCETTLNGYAISFSLHDIIYNDKLRLFALEDIIFIMKTYAKNTISTTNEFVNNSYKYYSILVLALVICLITSSIAATKICNIFGFEIDGGSFTFPISYIINDLITERYGFKAARNAIITSLVSFFIISSILYFVAYLPEASGVNNHDAFFQIFSFTPIIFIATLLSYLIGELTNSLIMSKLKLKYNGSYFAGRAILSTAVGALIDTSIFCYIAFISIIEITQINKMILVLTCSKVGYELILMPLTIKLLNFLKRNAT